MSYSSGLSVEDLIIRAGLTIYGLRMICALFLIACVVFTFGDLRVQFDCLVNLCAYLV